MRLEGHACDDDIGGDSAVLTWSFTRVRFAAAAPGEVDFLWHTQAQLSLAWAECTFFFLSPALESPVRSGMDVAFPTSRNTVS